MDLISHHLFVYREVHISPCRFKNNNKIENKERHNKIFTGEAIDKQHYGDGCYRLFFTDFITKII